MNIYKSFASHYKCLPKTTFPNKVRFAIWKYLGKQLVRRKVIDNSGTLLVPRQPKVSKGTPSKTFKHIVCVNGFTSSGSSAVIDLLSEYRNVTTCLSGTLADPVLERNRKRFEFDLVRAAGGLYALEDAFNTKNIYIQDAAVRLFMALAEYFYSNATDFFDDRFIIETRKFVRSLIDCETITPKGFDYCMHLSALGTHSANFILGHEISDPWEYLYYLKDIDVHKYRELAREYLYSILRNVESEDYLVLDQGGADYNCDLDKAKLYFGDSLKSIYVWRDPRDVFTRRYNIRNTEGCIPHNVDDFIRWYRRYLPNFQKLSRDDMLLIRFEDLLMDYNHSVKIIEEFLGLDGKDHIRPQTALIPQKSIEYSMGIWKAYPDIGAIDKIHKELKEYCFKG